MMVLKVTYIKKVFLNDSSYRKYRGLNAKAWKPSWVGVKCVQGREEQGFSETCSHPVTTARATPPTFSPGANFQNEPANLYFSH